MRYKIVETEKDQRQKELNGNTMLYKKTKIEHDSSINEYEMVVTYFENDIDFVVGNRVKKFREKGAMQPQQIFGNWLATFLMRVFFKSKFTDLGPFRAIKFDTLMSLKMEDPTYGWTVEMQLKILKELER